MKSELSRYYSQKEKKHGSKTYQSPQDRQLKDVILDAIQDVMEAAYLLRPDAIKLTWYQKGLLGIQVKHQAFAWLMTDEPSSFALTVDGEILHCRLTYDDNDETPYYETSLYDIDEYRGATLELLAKQFICLAEKMQVDPKKVEEIKLGITSASGGKITWEITF